MEKVNSLLAQEVGHILNKKTPDLGLGFITVTAAECSKDLRSAKIWISVLGKNRAENLKIINKNIRQIQSELNKRIEMKFCPKIRFCLDNSENHYHKIDKLLKDEKREIG